MTLFVAKHMKFYFSSENYFEICSVKTRRMVEKMFTCKIWKCSGRLSKPSEGSGLRHAHWGKPSHQMRLRFRTLWLKQLLGSKGHIFRSCRVLVPACVPIRDLPGLYPQALSTWFASLIHYSGVGCFSGERTPNSYTLFSIFSLYPCYFGDSFKLLISWLNPILHMKNPITWPIVAFFFIFSILSLYYLKNGSTAI